MNRVLSAAQEALAFAKSEVDRNEYAVHATENNDVKQDSDIDPGVRPGHIAHWTPERIAADPEAAHAGLDLVSRSVSFISERIDLAMDLVEPEMPKE